MAHAFQTLLDIALLNESAIGPVIELNKNAAPELAEFPARVLGQGVTSYESLLRTGLPTGSFRDSNEGVFASKSSYQLRKVETQLYESMAEIDINGVLNASKEPDRVKLLEAIGHTRAAMLHIGSQTWYGTVNDAKGFPGAQSVVDSTLVLDAGGTSATTGSSVYGVKFGEEFCQYQFGGSSALSFEWSQPQWIDRTIKSETKRLWALIGALSTRVGMQWVNPYGLCRMKDFTADAGKGVTDAALAELLSILPVGSAPDAWFMTRRSRRQLQVSRAPVITAMTSNQPLVYPPIPTESNGIRIIVTDSLLNTEALTA